MCCSLYWFRITDDVLDDATVEVVVVLGWTLAPPQPARVGEGGGKKAVEKLFWFDANKQRHQMALAKIFGRPCSRNALVILMVVVAAVASGS
jgi:hypothetical protein